MQTSNKNTLILAKKTGEIITKLRKPMNKSVNKLENEYDFGGDAIRRIEKGSVNCKFVTLWMIAESLGIKPSELVKKIEESLPEDFRLTEE